MLFSFMIFRHTGWYLHASKLERGDDQHCPTVRISGTQQERRWWGHTVHSVVLYSFKQPKTFTEVFHIFHWLLHLLIDPSIHPSILPSTHLSIHSPTYPCMYPLSQNFELFLHCVRQASISSKKQRQNMTENQSPRVKDWDINYCSKKTFQDLN